MQDYTGFSELADQDNFDSSVVIHPRAYVSKGAELAKGVKIGPAAMIGPKVKLAEGVKVGAGAIIDGRTVVGAHTQVFPYATLGSAPQDLKYQGEDTELIIGERNRFREYVNVSLGTVGGGGKTVIGNDNLIMVYTHVGHDCIIGNECIFANGVALAGHVEIGNRVVFGGLSGAHQFSHFGDMVMVAAGAMVSQDAPPFCIVHGNHARANGLNMVGIRRSGTKNLSALKQMYRLVYQENLTIEDAISRIEKEVDAVPERDVFVTFLRTSKRGICR